LNEYELLYIVHPRKAADEVPSVIEWVNGLVQQGGGESLSVDDWGRRRLAYPIAHEFEATYVLATFRLPPESTAALESQLVISEDIMRHILIHGIIPFEGRREDTVRAEEAVAPAAAEPPAAEPPAEPAVEETPPEPPVEAAVGASESEGESASQVAEPSPATAGAE
jgi:small subunit ribosomal protein S6